MADAEKQTTECCLVGGGKILRFLNIEVESDAGSVKYQVIIEGEVGTRWVKKSEICNLSAEAKKMANDKWMEKYKQQVADPRRSNKTELYEVRRVTKCHILKEPFEQCEKKQFYYSVKWEGFEDQDCLEPERTLGKCGTEVKAMMTRAKRKVLNHLKDLEKAKKMWGAEAPEYGDCYNEFAAIVLLSSSQILPQKDVIGFPEVIKRLKKEQYDDTDSVVEKGKFEPQCQVTLSGGRASQAAQPTIKHLKDFRRGLEGRIYDVNVSCKQ